MKRIVSIQDLSCVGKCSLGIALPVLSVMGLECAALPTALLSAHTAFDGFFCRDLTDCIGPIMAHWQDAGLRFDAIATGYLGSCAQVRLVEAMFDRFDVPLHFVDPVMADHGRLYSGVDPELPQQMRRLVRRADMITPNVTEACLLTGLPYDPQPADAALERLLDGLLALDVDTAVITGIRHGDGLVRTAAASRSGERFSVEGPDIPGVFHGTGDLFAAVCAGALTLGLTAKSAVSLAARFVAEALEQTRRDPDARWYGVQFEPVLARLPELLCETKMKEDLT